MCEWSCPQMRCEPLSNAPPLQASDSCWTATVCVSTWSSLASENLPGLNNSLLYYVVDLGSQKSATNDLTTLKGLINYGLLTQLTRRPDEAELPGCRMLYAYVITITKEKR